MNRSATNKSTKWLSGMRVWAMLLAALALLVLPAAACDPNASLSENVNQTGENIDEAGEEIADEVDDAL